MMTTTAPSPTSEKTRVTRVRSYNSSHEPVLEMLRDERFTGKIVVHMSQGTVSVVEVEDTARLTGTGS
jgi:hypothetical protein